ncbi:MAG: type II toxin-antitoxin system VapC family toxin [Candidatus Acidiferrum sp.]
MKFLLDTHIWLWLIGNRVKLAAGLLKDLQNTDNEIWLSPISIWEALTLHRKGRMFLGPNLAAWVAHAVSGTKEAAFTHEIVLAAMQLSLHQDPADRFLAATAQVLDLILVTADQRLLGLGNIRTLANR